MVVGWFLSELTQNIKFYMFPFYYSWLPNSKTAFVCLLAQVYPEVVKKDDIICEQPLKKLKSTYRKSKSIHFNSRFLLFLLWY